MNNGEYLKDLFVQKRYDDLIQALQIVYCGLFEEMLEYKDVKEKEILKKLNFRNLTILVSKYYPEYYPNITMIKSVSFLPYYSYLDIINTYLDNYEYLRKNYKS